MKITYAHSFKVSVFWFLDFRFPMATFVMQSFLYTFTAKITTTPHTFSAPFTNLFPQICSTTEARHDSSSTQNSAHNFSSGCFYFLLMYNEHLPGLSLSQSNVRRCSVAGKILIPHVGGCLMT